MSKMGRYVQGLMEMPEYAQGYKAWPKGPNPQPAGKKAEAWSLGFWDAERDERG